MVTLTSPPPPVQEQAAVRWVDSSAALASLLDVVAAEPRLAVDTESDGFFRYRARLCLLQLGWEGGVALVDPLAGLDLLPLWELLADPARECILHDAEQDVNLLRRERGVALGRLFDTCAAARIVGIRQVGLGNLVQAQLAIGLDKREQRSDWGQRPLRAGQLSYAAADVLHLLSLRDRLAARLKALGRSGQADQEFERIRRRVLEERPFDPDAWRNLAEARALDPPGRGVLAALWKLREELAEDRDLAPFRLIAPTGLIALAHHRPRTIDAMATVPGLSARLVHGPEGRRVLDAILEAPPFHGPLRPPRRSETEAERIQNARYEALRAWRAQVATAWDVEVGVIAPNALLAELARQAPHSLSELACVPDLLPWRVQAFGPAILDVLRGAASTEPVRAPVATAP